MNIMAVLILFLKYIGENRFLGEKRISTAIPQLLEISVMIIQPSLKLVVLSHIKVIGAVFYRF